MKKRYRIVRISDSHMPLPEVNDKVRNLPWLRKGECHLFACKPGVFFAQEVMSDRDLSRELAGILR